MFDAKDNEIQRLKAELRIKDDKIAILERDKSMALDALAKMNQRPKLTVIPPPIEGDEFEPEA